MIIQEFPTLGLPKRFDPKIDKDFNHYFVRLFETLPSANQIINPDDDSDPFEAMAKFVLDGAVFKIMIRALLDAPALAIHDMKSRSRKNE